MSKKKHQGQPSIAEISIGDAPVGIEPPTDILTVKIFSLGLHHDPPALFSIKATFFDQLILSSVIKSTDAKHAEQKEILATGSMGYDPSDSEKMCMFANCPLVVHIQPIKIKDVTPPSHAQGDNLSNTTESSTQMRHAVHVSCCNVDILPIFLNDEENPKIFFVKRMEPLIAPSALQMKSWDCLPLLSMEVSVTHHQDNKQHYKILKNSNWMKLTLIGAYNMLIPFDDEYVYTAASKTLLNHEYNTAPAMFNQGYKVPRRFNITNFYPKWETLRVGDDSFTKGDEKFLCKLEDIQNNDNFDLQYYINEMPQNTVLWCSFHRILLNKSSEKWLAKHIQQYKWPLEVHIYGENDGYSFMAFMDLFPLLYPGEHTVRLAVPLQWINSASMMQECNCPLLLTPVDKALTFAPVQIDRVAPSSGKLMSETSPSGSSLATGPPLKTGADDNNAFAIIEIKLKRPLKKSVIPPKVPLESIETMLKLMEKAGVDKRSCTGRGQQVRDWQATLRYAAASLRKVPYYGATELCAFNRQLSETRTRVELVTSFWQEAAVYLNNNFVIQQYLRPDDGRDIYEEMVMVAHACMMRTAKETLLGEHRSKDTDPVLKAARHARQMQDMHHATDLYLQMTVKMPNDGQYWRELSTCLKDIDKDWANVCLNKAVVLDPRHPLTLISKGGMLFEEDPRAAEIFFDALLALYPFWTTAWVIASAYYFHRGQYVLADEILTIVNLNRKENIARDLSYGRAWERELGDWWDSIPFLPGTSFFCDAADMLLRLRCVALAEICVARLLTFSEESALYYYLVALCCRLRRDYKEALCHLRAGQTKFGKVNYMKTLEAECLHKMNDIPASMACYNSASFIGTSYNTLMSMPINTDPTRVQGILVDLVRRQPSAYVWLAIADNWLKKLEQNKTKAGKNDEEHISGIRCQIACAVEALKWDRSAAKAWALLGKLVKPSARRYHCLKMAALCGQKVNAACFESESQSQQSSCYYLGVAITPCTCPMCERLRL